MHCSEAPALLFILNQITNMKPLILGEKPKNLQHWTYPPGKSSRKDSMFQRGYLEMINNIVRFWIK